ncbi:MAG: hypothetical protein SF053_03345 [Bacteroidia bacterium]|nr:hypothetical protein [Bacteroidia bacterium]
MNHHLTRYTWVMWLLVAACGSADLSLINQVNRFEPEWMDLSTRVTFIDSHLRIARQRYEKDRDEVSPSLSAADSTTGFDPAQFTTQYRNLIQERDQIQAKFDLIKKQFVEEVTAFNAWENKLMQEDAGGGEATREFARFRQRHEELKTELEQLHGAVVGNLDKHNTLLRQASAALRLYSNYDIDYD